MTGRAEARQRAREKRLAQERERAKSESLPSHQLVRVKHDVDEHVQFVLDCDDRPTIGFSVGNPNGRRIFHISVDGMGIFSGLLDVEHLGPKSNRIARFCPYCGEELVLLSSRLHSCEQDDRPGPLLQEIIRLRRIIEEMEPSES